MAFGRSQAEPSRATDKAAQPQSCLSAMSVPAELCIYRTASCAPFPSIPTKTTTIPEAWMGDVCLSPPHRPAATLSVYLFWILFPRRLCVCGFEGHFARLSLTRVRRPSLSFKRCLARHYKHGRELSFLLLICNCGTNTVAITGFSCTEKRATRRLSSVVPKPRAFPRRGTQETRSETAAFSMPTVARARRAHSKLKYHGPKGAEGRVCRSACARNCPGVLSGLIYLRRGNTRE